MPNAHVTPEGNGQTAVPLKGVRQFKVTRQGNVKDPDGEGNRRNQSSFRKRSKRAIADDNRLIQRISAHIVVRLRAGTLAESDIDRAIDEALAVAP